MLYLDELCYKDEIKLLLNSSNPERISELRLIEFKKELKFNRVTYFIKGNLSPKFKISFPILKHKFNGSIRYFALFLEKIISIDKPLIFHMLKRGAEFFIYIEPTEKNNLRVCIFNTQNLHNKSMKGQILDYTINEADINLDIIITKKTLIKQLYSSLEKLADDFFYEEFFEKTPVKVKIRKSKMIEEYLKTPLKNYKKENCNN